MTIFKILILNVCIILFFCACKQESKVFDETELISEPVNPPNFGKTDKDTINIVAFQEKFSAPLKLNTINHYYPSLDADMKSFLPLEKEDLNGLHKQVKGALELSYDSFFGGRFQINNELDGYLWVQIDGFNFSRYILTLFSHEENRFLPNKIFLADHAGDAGLDQYNESWIIKNQREGLIIYSQFCETLAESSDYFQEEKKIKSKSGAYINLNKLRRGKTSFIGKTVLVEKFEENEFRFNSMYCDH